MRDCQSSHPRELLPLHSCRGTSGRRKRRGPRVHPKLCARCSHLKRCCCPTHAAYTPEGAYRSNRWLWCTSVSVRRLSCPSCARRSPLRGSLGTRDMCVICDVWLAFSSTSESCDLATHSGVLLSVPLGWGRCGEIQGALPAVWDIGNMAGEYGEPCGYMSGDLLLTSQVPQAGNLETMMRILINSAGTLCAFNCTPPWGDRLLRMATLLFGSRSKSTGTEWRWV